MKRYVKPLINCIEIRPEERLAAVCEKEGSCTEQLPYDIDNNGIPDLFTLS